MAEQNSDEINIKDVILNIKSLLLYFKKYWLIILLLGLTGAIAGYIYAYKQKFIYTASLVFALAGPVAASREARSGSAISGLASQFGFDMGGGSAGGAFAGANLIELMKSRSLVEKTLLNPMEVNGSTISIAEYYIRLMGWREQWKDKPGLGNIQFLPNPDRQKYTLQQDSILGVIYQKLISNNNLRVAQNDKKVSFITIQVISTDEMFSKLMTENLAKEVSTFYVETKSKKAKINVAIIEHQIDSVRGELNAAISGIAVINDNTYNLNPGMNVNRVRSSTRQVDVQSSTAILTELVKNLVMANVTLQRETPLIQIVDRPILPLPKERVGKLRSMQIGGFVGGIIALLILTIRRWWKKNMMNA